MTEEPGSPGWRRNDRAADRSRSWVDDGARQRAEPLDPLVAPDLLEACNPWPHPDRPPRRRATGTIWARVGIGFEIAGQMLVTAGTTPTGWPPKRPSRCSAASPRCPLPPVCLSGTASAVTGNTFTDGTVVTVSSGSW